MRGNLAVYNVVRVLYDVESFFFGFVIVGRFTAVRVILEIFEICVLRVKELLGSRLVSPVYEIGMDSAAVFVLNKQFSLCGIDKQRYGRRQFVCSVFVDRELVLVRTVRGRGRDYLDISETAF